MRGLTNCHSAPAHPKEHHDRTTGRTKHSRVVPNATKQSDHRECRAAYLCVTSESSRPGIARVASQTNASIPQDRRARASHCKRWLRLTLGDPSRGAAGRRGGRLECALLPGTRAPSSPRYTAALVDAPLRSLCRASPCCGKPHRTAPPTRPTPSLRPRSPPSSTPPEVCLETMEFDVRRTHGTTTTHAPHSSPQGSLRHDEHALPSRALLAPAPSRAAAHLVITRKEIRCTRCQ